MRSSLAKMQGGEISPLDAESSYQKFRKKLQAFVVEVNDVDDGVRKMSYPTTSFGKMAPDAVSKRGPSPGLRLRLTGGGALTSS